MAAVSSEQHGPITTLKVSVNNECNLQCFYCKTIGRANELLPASKTLIPAADYSKIMKIAAEAGIERVLIGGGEPLLRKDISQVTKAIVNTKKLREVRFVTNGTFLKNYADALKRIGLKHIEINLDSLNFMVYQKVSRRDSLHRVIDGLEKAERLDFDSLILNIIMMRGVNDREIIDLAVMTKTRPIELRFIEYVTNEPTLTAQLHLPAHLVKRSIENFQVLKPVIENGREYFKFADAVGRISFHNYQNGYLAYPGSRLVLNSEGFLYVDYPHGRMINIAKELERDGWDERIYKIFTKLMHPAGVEAKPEKVAVKPSARRVVTTATRKAPATRASRPRSATL